jgi:hypothetical protein
MTQPKANVPAATSESAPLARRTVFVGAGAVGALAAAAAVLPLSQEAAPAPKQAQSGNTEGGYQLTEHVQRYYQTARV